MDSYEDGRDGATPWGHHPKFDRRGPTDREAKERQGEQVYHTPAHNAMASSP
jgi:hypothetical protein